MPRRASNTKPAPPRTGYAHRRCYALELDDCSKDLSREHYISAGLLKEIGDFDVTGLGFVADETKLPVAALTSKILCRRHNSALSPLDVAAASFFVALRHFDHGFRDEIEAPTTESETINGDDLERWCLKTLAGLHHASIASDGGLRPELAYVALLFGESGWPKGWGFSASLLPETRYAFSGLGIRTLTDGDEGATLGAEFNIAGFSFLLHFGEVDRKRWGYRPRGLQLMRKGSSARKSLWLSWSGRERSSLIDLTRSASHHGPRPFDQ